MIETFRYYLGRVIHSNKYVYWVFWRVLVTVCIVLEWVKLTYETIYELLTYDLKNYLQEIRTIAKYSMREYRELDYERSVEGFREFYKEETE